MLIKILIGVAAVVVVFLIVVALQPSKYRVVRTMLISVPPPAIFERVNDFHNWEAWNPWGKIDPAMRSTYSGPASGRGAVYEWVGNNQVGEGRMTITDSRPSDSVRIKLDFIKPFAAVATADFTFEPQGDKTAVAWAMTGSNNFMAKAVHLFMNMDKMIGGQFEKGLTDLKAIVESAAQPTATATR